ASTVVPSTCRVAGRPGVEFFCSSPIRARCRIVPPRRHFRAGRQRRPQNDQADRGPPGQEDFLLLDDQDPVSHRPLLYATSATAGSGDRGLIRRIVVPRPGALSLSISPPCSSMLFLTIA